MAGLLVLGASGLLGRAVVAEAHRIGASPVVAVTRGIHAATGVDAWRPLDLATASIASVADLLESTAPDVIINCAGATHGDRQSLVQANVATVGVVLEAVARWGGRPRIIQVGSAAEYKALLIGTDTREDSPTDPQSAYGITKLAASRLVNVAASNNQVDGIVARVFNPLGPDMPDSSMPGRAVRLLGTAAKEGLDVVTMASLDASRDFVDLRDIASALLLLANTGDLPHRTYNVGSGVAFAVRDVVHQIAAAVGFVGEIRETLPSSPRSGTVAWQRADISRLTELGWRANHDLSSSISDLVTSAETSKTPRRADERP